MWTRLPGEKRIALDDENLQYTGRIDFADPQNPVFLFTASFVRFRMTGHHLRVVLTNTHHLWENRLGVVINGEQFGVLLDWDTLNVIDLSDHLRDGENDVMLFKRQDSCYKMTLHALLIDENATLLPPPARPNRRIEFYGDSVSAGEVSEVTEYAGKLDPPDHQARYNNVWFSYAWQTARLLNAEISDIAQGGIALQDGNGYFFDTGMLSCWDKLAYNPFFHDENRGISAASRRTSSSLRLGRTTPPSATLWQKTMTANRRSAGGATTRAGFARFAENIRTRISC